MLVYAMSILRQFIETNFDEGRYNLYLKGLIFVLNVTFLATLFGLILGIILSIFRFSNDYLLETKFKKFVKINPFYWFSCIYVEIIRGTPLLVQLLILSNFIIVGSLKNLDVSIICSIGIGINSAAYIAEIIRSGINSLDKGQMEAARALGMSYIDSMKFIILPQAFKNMLPTFVNEFIVLLKETSVVGFIGGMDLMKAAETVTFKTYRGTEPYIAVAIIYLIITSLFTLVMRKVERRVGKSD